MIGQLQPFRYSSSTDNPSQVLIRLSLFLIGSYSDHSPGTQVSLIVIPYTKGVSLHFKDVPDCPLYLSNPETSPSRGSDRKDESFTGLGFPGLVVSARSVDPSSVKYSLLTLKFCKTINLREYTLLMTNEVTSISSSTKIVVPKEMKVH